MFELLREEDWGAPEYAGSVACSDLCWLPASESMGHRPRRHLYLGAEPQTKPQVSTSAASCHCWPTVWPGFEVRDTAPGQNCPLPPTAAGLFHSPEWEPFGVFAIVRTSMRKCTGSPIPRPACLRSRKSSGKVVRLIPLVSEHCAPTGDCGPEATASSPCTDQACR